MKIVACIKQVPASESKITSNGNDIKRESISYVVNPYDEFGVEEALRIAERFPESQVTVVTIGPQKAEEALRTSLAMGADKAVRIDPGQLGNKDSFIVATLLAAAIKKLDPDIVLTGKQSIDDDTGAVGIQLAELLGMAHVSSITKLDIQDSVALATRPVEADAEIVEVTLPALFTCQKGLNEPRFASLPGIMKAKSKPLEILTTDDLGIDTDSFECGITVLELTPPPKRTRGNILEGEPTEAAKELVRLLHEEVRII